MIRDPREADRLLRIWAKADIRAIPQHIAIQILTAIHRPAAVGAGQVKTLRGQSGEKRLRVGDFRARITEDRGGSTEGGQGKVDDTLRIHSVRNRREARR